MTEALPDLEDVSEAQWEHLAERRIFFGHQSVGGNIIEGIQDVLADHPEIPLRVIETSDPEQMDAPGLYHALVGENGAPATKLDAFSEIVSQGALAELGTAMLKYCYIDIGPDTDPVALFETYRDQVDALRAGRPGLTVVHVTLPLTADRGTVKYWSARVRGLLTERQLNALRERYNELLRQTYAGNEPIIDLASWESIRPDGSIAEVRHRGESIPVLASPWTYDGAHLNDAGQGHIAEAFLATLAKMAP